MKEARFLALLIIFSLFCQIILLSDVAAVGGNLTRPSVSVSVSLPGGDNLPDGDDLTDSSDAIEPETIVQYFGTVPPDKVFTIFFTTAVDVLTITGTTIKVINSEGQEVPVQLVTAINGMSVTVTPQSEYPSGDYILKSLDGILSALTGRSITNLAELHFTVAGNPEPDRIDLTPSYITLQPGQTTRFSAALIGGNSDLPFIWSTYGAHDYAGTIMGDGTYQAPLEPGYYTVSVRSDQYPALSAHASVQVQSPSAGAIDLALGEISLDVPSGANPGQSVVLKATVYNQSESGKCPGGTVVRFFVDNRVVDEVPIYIAAGDTSVQARVWYYLPETSAYSAMEFGESIPATVRAIVDPHGRLAETNESNNEDTAIIQVRYVYDQPMQDTDPQLTIDATGLSVWSVKDDAPGNRLSAAQPGQKLHLMARIQATGDDRSEDINIKFLINGLVVYDNNRRVATLGGSFESACDYQVPFNQTENLDFDVLLSNGSTAGISIPVQRYDVGIMPGDLYWTKGIDSGYATPGQKIRFHAKAKNISSIQFPHEDARIAWRALVNGQLLAEGDYRLYANELNPTLPDFTVPLNQTGPVIFTFITDPYNQLDESDETNNIASIEIPLAEDLQVRNNMYIEPIDLLCQPTPLVPGSTLLLSVDIHRQGIQLMPQNAPVAVLFMINGTLVGTRIVASNLFKPMQAHQVTYEWTDTLNLAPGEATFEVIVQAADEDHPITETSYSDNSASMMLEVVKPDLDVSGSCIRWAPDQPATGSTVRLKAIVKNSGDGPAIGSKIRFFADGAAIGRGDVTLSQINSATAAYAELDWYIPSTSQIEIPYNNLIGYTGKQEVPSMVTKEIRLTVQADPRELIQEKDETNNHSAAQILSAVIPTERKFVFIRVLDAVSSVPDAKVTLTAESGEKDTAQTSNDGWCSFTGVPVGNYSISIEKQGYNPFSMGGQILTTSPQQYRTFMIIRNQDFIGMSGTDSDGDMISDDDETDLYGTRSNDPDTDNDGVIDGRDLAPLTNPADPSQEIWQKTGMIRYEQAVGLHGVDGKADIYDVTWHLFSDDTLTYLRTYNSSGTYTSNMASEDVLIAAINDAFGPDYTAYDLENVEAEDISHRVATDYPELFNDSSYEAMYVLNTGIFEKQYRIDYNFIVDYQIASLKNSQETRYPTENCYFGYLLMPVAVSNGHKHTFTFQLQHADLADKIYYNSDNSYHELGFQYSFYRSDNYDLDSNLPSTSGIALAECDGTDLFEFSVTLPADQADQSLFYLKITPSWVDKHNNQVSLEPIWDAMEGESGFTWNLTGLVREIVYQTNTEGDSQIVRQSLTSVDDLSSDTVEVSTIRNLANAESAKTWHPEDGIDILIYNPEDPEGKLYRTVEMDQEIIFYVGEGTEYVKSTLELIETVNVVRNGYNSLEGLPANSIFRTPGYEALTDGLDLIGGIVSIYTDGKEAWMAYQNDDKIICAFYAARTAAEVISESNTLIKISVNIAAVAGKTGRFAKFPANQVGLGITVVISLIDLSFSFYKYSTATCTVQKTANAEAFMATEIDLALFAAGFLFPPLGAFELTWFAVHELYGLAFGKDLAYRITDSFSEVVVTEFLIQSEADIPSEIAKDGYEHAIDNLTRRFELIVEDRFPFVPVFVDPTD